jgi:hypothetical protein
MRRTVLAAAIALAGLNTAVAAEWVVEARYPDLATLRAIAPQFQHVRIDRKRQLLRTTVDEAGIERLQAAGLPVQVDTVASARLHEAVTRIAAARASGVATRNPAGYDAIPDYPCYRTVEGTYATMDDLAAQNPAIAAVEEIGPSWERTQDASAGYLVRVMRITNLATAAVDPDRPRMVVFGSIHAREYAPAEINTRFAEWLVHGYGHDPEATWLVDHNDFRLVLQVNPDGRKHAEQGDLWRKNTNDVDGNCSVAWGSDGIDLNRNFPFHWGIVPGNGGSSGLPCDETFRGPVKMSEPETENLVAYVAGTCTSAGECSGGVFADRRSGSMNPSALPDDGGPAAEGTSGFFVDLHSYSNLVMWPWGDTGNPAPDRDPLRTLGRRLAWFNGYRPQQSDELYPTDGTTVDTMYGLLGVASYTFETDEQFFQQCSTFEGDTAPKNIDALRYAARALHAPYRLPSGPDTLAVGTGSDLVASGDVLAISALLDGSRFNQSNGQEPLRDIAAANATVDALPWQDGAVAIALEALDGSFDSAREGVAGTLDAGALGVGRHFVYVQGIDTAGNPGTPTAAMVDVVDAASVGTLEGRVTDLASGEALAATVTLSNAAESHVATSNGATGEYRAHGYPGSYDVHVSAPHHLAEDLQDVALAAGGTVAHDFALYATCTLFEDDMESGPGAWTAGSEWTIQSVPGHDSLAWNTPDYSCSGSNCTLTTAASIDLTGYADAAISFDDRCATEAGYDYGRLEYQLGGGSWQLLYSCNGRSNWESHVVALPAAADNAPDLRLRFRIDADSFVNDAGWALDNIRVEAGGEACRAQQQPPEDDTLFRDGFDGP